MFARAVKNAENKTKKKGSQRKLGLSARTPRRHSPQHDQDGDRQDDVQQVHGAGQTLEREMVRRAVHGDDDDRQQRGAHPLQRVDPTCQKGVANGVRKDGGRRAETPVGKCVPSWSASTILDVSDVEMVSAVPWKKSTTGTVTVNTSA